MEKTDSGKYDVLSKNYKLINKYYMCHLNNVIGSGTFGKVLYCSSIDGKKEFAIKFEKSNVKSSVIASEYEIYEQLKGCDGIPKIYWTGEFRKYKLMVMDLLGPSLDKYFTYCNKKFSTITTCLIGIEMVKRIQYIHSMGYLHRDVKPNNFMLGKFSKNLACVNEKKIYAIDFGLSKEYIDFTTDEHLPFKDGRKFIGTPRYASIGTHLGHRQSRRDDLESIAYILIYFVLGDLPWQGVKAKSKGEKKEKILEIKLKANFANDKRIPKEFISFLDHCKKIKYEEKPDYKNIIKLLNSAISNNSKGKEFDASTHFWEWNNKMLSSLEDDEKMEVEEEEFNKLFDGYPISSFSNYLKTLIDYKNNSSNNTNLPTTSSTTSNTNPTNNIIYQEDSNNSNVEFSIEKTMSSKDKK